ncbi:MAG: hypothetical protein IJ343_11695 [Clostridia bacterium]|nr:hypothetical protein [Clostridia bacterium]
MKSPVHLIQRHSNLILMLFLCTTLFVSSVLNQRRLADSTAAIALPVMKTQPAVSAVAAYAEDRDAAYRRDIAALTALCSQENLDARTREDAAEALTQLVKDHAAQLALEDALSGSILAPCAAVVSSGSVTIVTQLTDISAEASALALTLAAAHAAAEPSDVRIVTAE